MRGDCQISPPEQMHMEGKGRAHRKARNQEHSGGVMKIWGCHLRIQVPQWEREKGEDRKIENGTGQAKASKWF